MGSAAFTVDSMYAKRIVLSLVVLGTLGSVRPASAQPVRSGFYDVNVYRDVRAVSTLTVNVLANLPVGLQYFAFTNYSNGLNDPAADLQTFYSEQHLRWAPSSRLPVDLTALWNLRGGAGNDVLRFGTRWRPGSTPGLASFFARIRLDYGITLHLANFGISDEPGWQPQLEHGYSWELVERRLFVGGFLDHDLRVGGAAGSARSRIVTEHQLGLAVAEGLRVVVEYRLNEYMSARQSGVGFGLQYIVPFASAS